MSSKIKVIKYVDGKPVESTVDYFPKKASAKILTNPMKVKKKKPKRKKIKPASNKFYKSEEWLQLRYRVLSIFQAKCMCCGRTPSEHGIVVHVDHIKPRSKYPELELDINNMQILCAACNLGKSNLDNTNWRSLSNNDIYLIKQSEKFG